ncbi:bifunctional metallophosphatase/5'-nucleotidase [Bacillus salitolerans]|uniref:Bifunctional metallophosphatase/5'-nucleotidase n=1 Tax=Bacillus salitolerans TaxID=1437434 RepID=A0ABW4LRN4_9BACI
MGKRLHIYHINDLHSHFDNWTKVVSFIKSERKRLDEIDEDMIVVDIGDHMDRFHPISEASLGRANVRLMNQIGYQYVTIGNNEGITLSHEQLNTLYNEANFKVIVSNLFRENGERPTWASSYELHETSYGSTIAFIGATVAFQKFYELLEWKVTDPLIILPEIIQEVKENGAEYVVLLSHLGVNEDERIANEIEGIDLILGGHTHHLFPEGKTINSTLVCAAGKFGYHVGHVTIDYKEKEVTSIVHSMDEVPECSDTKEYLIIENKVASMILEEKIGSLSRPLEVHWFKQSILPEILAGALKEWCKAEIGMVNAGVLLDSLRAGDLTVGELHRICPHPINPCKVILQGDELKEVILQAATERMEKLEMKGFGFRGKVLGKMIYDGIEFDTTSLTDGLPHVRNIRINGQPIEAEREYVIATLDMFTFGRLFPEIMNAKYKEYYLPEMIRDLLKWKLRRKQ